MALLPPTNLQGTYQNRPSNINTLQVKLTWVAPAGDLFDKYFLYRNDLKSVEIDNTILEYLDEDMAKNVNYMTYYLTTWKDGDPSTESVPSAFLSNFSLGLEELITRLRTILMDFPTDPRMKRWTDDELLEFLNISLGDVNSAPPMSNYSFETIPPAWTSLVLIRAKYEAYTGRAGLEVAKEFNFGFGGVSVAIDRSGKYLSVSQQEWNAYNERLTKAKLASVMNVVAPMGILTNDLPFKIRTYSPRQFRIR